MISSSTARWPPVIATHVLPGRPTRPPALLLVLATFGVGFGVRPLGAILFGILGDKLGRKYTFLVTITLMGLATAAVGLLPTYAQIGIAAPILLVICRLLQGLALGGEYGGAAIYVAEHAPQNKRGFYTSFIQASVIGGFLLSVAVVLASNCLVSAEARERLGLADPVPVLAAAARRLALGAAEAQGEPGLPGDEGGGRDRAQSAAGELPTAGSAGQDDPRRLVRHRRRASP